jgi:hypothetical protein
LAFAILALIAIFAGRVAFEDRRDFNAKMVFAHVPFSAWRIAIRGRGNLHTNIVFTLVLIGALLIRFALHCNALTIEALLVRLTLVVTLTRIARINVRMHIRVNTLGRIADHARI